jgi:hypothetical protein
MLAIMLGYWSDPMIVAWPVQLTQVGSLALLFAQKGI